MSDKKIKHFVFMRFFNSQTLSYPYNVLYKDFLSKQIILAKNNALKSLENQTNKNFDLVFILHERVFRDKNYEFVISDLQNATTLPLKFIKSPEQSVLVKEALNEFDFVIYSRYDLDDFLFKDAIADTHNKVNDCDSVLAYGYCKGYTYVFDELYTHYKLWGNRGHSSLLQSLIWKSSFAKNLPYLPIYKTHPNIKLWLKKFLEDNGIEFTKKMFQQNTSDNAYIYFRHEFSRDQFVTLYSNPVKPPEDKNPITTEEITAAQLKSEFGFEYELKSIK